MLSNKWYHVKVPLKGFYLNGHTIGFDLQSQKLELHYVTATFTLVCFIIAANSSKRSPFRSLASVYSFLFSLFSFLASNRGCNSRCVLTIHGHDPQRL